MKIAFACIAALLAVDASAAVAMTDQAEPPKEKKICRRDSSVGTRLAKITCLTRSQWNARENAARENKDRMLDNAEREGRDSWQPYAQPVG